MLLSQVFNLNFEVLDVIEALVKVLGELDIIFLKLDHSVLNIDILFFLEHFNNVFGSDHFIQIAL